MAPYRDKFNAAFSNFFKNSPNITGNVYAFATQPFAMQGVNI